MVYILYSLGYKLYIILVNDNYQDIKSFRYDKNISYINKILTNNLQLFN